MIKNVLCAFFIFLSQNIFAQINLEESTSNVKIKIENLENDKEAASRVLNQDNMRWFKHHYSEDFAQMVKDAVYNAVLYVKQDKDDDIACDVGLIQKIRDNLWHKGLNTDQVEVTNYFKVLRSYNYIDDIFLKLLMDLNVLETNLNNSSKFFEKPSYFEKKSNSFIIRNNNVKKLYAEFKKWPDEENKCLLGTWAKFKSQIYSKVKNFPKSKEIRNLNAYAFSKNIISRETFEKLEVLRQSDILERKIFLSGYLNKTFWAKNSMNPKNVRRYDIPIENENRFASLKAYRFSNISKREAFYHKYNEDQIVVLSKILKRASIRMGVDPDIQSSVPVIFQDLVYEDDNGELVTIRDEYRMNNAKDQYEYALRRMRMEMFETNYFKHLQHLKIAYEDIVLAALETGYISHEEVSIALQYDDLWNKQESKLWKAIKISMGIGSMAVFYLPPPYNIIGAISVALLNSGVIQKKSGEDNDNPNSIFN